MVCAKTASPQINHGWKLESVGSYKYWATQNEHSTHLRSEWHTMWRYMYTSVCRANALSKCIFFPHSIVIRKKCKWNWNGVWDDNELSSCKIGCMFSVSCDVLQYFSKHALGAANFYIGLHSYGKPGRNSLLQTKCCAVSRRYFASYI